MLLRQFTIINGHSFLVHTPALPHCGLNTKSVALAGVEIEGFKLINGKERSMDISISNGLKNT
jgi:hypothetical protein